MLTRPGNRQIVNCAGGFDHKLLVLIMEKCRDPLILQPPQGKQHAEPGRPVRVIDMGDERIGVFKVDQAHDSGMAEVGVAIGVCP